MVNQIIYIIINCIFPQSYLQQYLSTCTYLHFIQRCTTRIQNQDRLFSPFYYKDPFIKDCIIELKERNNTNVARLFGKHLSQYINREISHIRTKDLLSPIFLVPTPQHVSKTKEKEFIHTHTLTREIYSFILKQTNIRIFPCIQKITQTKRLHDLTGKHNRFKTITNTMKAYITKNDTGAYFFLIDDVYTTGATFQEMRRSLLDSGAFPERIYFISIAH